MKVEKRDGRIVDWDPIKIENAIRRAFESHKADIRPAKKLTDEVVKIIKDKNVDTIHIEEIQDIVEEVLMINGYTETAKRYIKYREKRAVARRLLRIVGVVDDLKLGPNAATVAKRYLLKDKDGNSIETPSQLFGRVANAVAKAEKIFDKSADYKTYEELFYDMIANLEFMPNSPTLYNAGTEIEQLSACFVLPIRDDIDSIFNTLWHMARVQKSGGGTGFSFSQLRPKGAKVGSTGGVASGPVSFMRVYDTATDVIKQGGRRRGANMAILQCDHPDIMEFIAAKGDKKSFRNFNISVAVTHEFMHALKTDGDIDLINPHTGEVEQTISARMIFDSMILNAWNTGDPGMIFIDRINDEHPLKGMQIESTNPCVTGDTLIAVADGRNSVSIEDLAREGRDVPVFCWSGDEMVVRMGRNPRKTREQVPIVEVTFDDESSIKLTKDHRVMLRDGSYVEACSLKEGDRIMPFFKIQYRQRGKKSKYWHIHQNHNVIHRGAHKIIAEFMLGRKLKRSEIVHHINYDTLDNSLTNLQIMTSKEHRKLHRQDMLGSNNPYHRMPEDWIKENMAVGRTGEDNGMFSRIHSYETRAKIGESTRRRFSDKKFRKKVREKMNEVMADQEIREKISIAAKERWKDSNLEGECPVCGTRIEYIKSKPQVCGSRGCSNTYRALNKPPMAELNHRVVLVQDHGISDVYNITVDECHNFATITREYESKKGNKKLSGIIVSNCGEQPLLPYESCVLGSINLSRMVKDGEVNWQRLGEIIPLAVRFLDNIIDLNKYPVEEIAIQTKATRKIGLGIMGWTEMLIQLRIPYDSEEALELAEKVMEFIRNRAERASAELAKVRGNFEHIDLLKQRRKWKRNATLITIAPTGSISLIAGTSSGIEPLFAIVHDRVLTEGVRLTDTNKYFVEIAEERGFWSEAVEQQLAATGSVQDVEGVPDDIKCLFKTAHEIDPEWHVRVQAAFQKHTDNAVSKTANLPNNASTEDIRRIFLLADELGLKGITVFRDGSLEGLQVLYAGCPTCEDVRFTDSP